MEGEEGRAGFGWGGELGGVGGGGCDWVSFAWGIRLLGGFSICQQYQTEGVHEHCLGRLNDPRDVAPNMARLVSIGRPCPCN